jgi:hypothetical protein
MMNELLTNELKKRGSAYERVIENFETQYHDLDHTYKTKKQELDKGLDRDLLAIDSVSISAKELCFDQYYKEIDGLQADYEHRAKEIYSGLSASIMSRA